MSASSPIDSPRDIGVVLPSAGRGERAGPGDPKQLREIGGIPMLLRALRPFAEHPRVAEIVIPVPRDLLDAPPPWLASVAGGRVRAVAGGATRAASVRRGVEALPAGLRGVLVHDAARPFVSRDTIDGVIAEVSRGRSAVAAIPVTDTIKRAAADGVLVAETVDRRGLWRAQTPQGFPLEVLRRVYETLGHEFGTLAPTDEATLVERAGYPVALVEDSRLNIKVTTPEDFRVAEFLASP